MKYLSSLLSIIKDIDPEQVKVELTREESYSVLEFNMILPD
jgi:septum formation topological specificity factor MinE